MIKRTIVVIAKVVIIVVLLDLAIFYFRLGWFLPIIWAAGVILALVATKREWKSDRVRTQTMIGIIALYFLSSLVAWQILFDRKSEVVFQMMWTDKGDRNTFAEPEIVLGFVEYPGHYVGHYSRQLKQLLEATGDSIVEVAFETTRDFGCLRGFREVRIANVSLWQSSWSYSGAAGSTPSPWGQNAWWCP